MFLRVALVLAGMSAGLIAQAQQPSAAPTVLLRDVRLIDGTGAAVREHVSLLLQNGRIEKIGETMIVLMVCSASVRDHQVMWPMTILPSRVAGPVAAKALQ